jgi:hypothetical protein
MYKMRYFDPKNRILVPAIALAVLGFAGVNVTPASAAVTMKKGAEVQTTSTFPAGTVQVAIKRKYVHRRAQRRAKRGYRIRRTGSYTKKRNFQGYREGHRNLRKEWCLDCGP